MESTVLTLRINIDTKDKLDRLAAATHRSKSFLAAEAINRYLVVKLGKLVKLNRHCSRPMLETLRAMRN